ncbi:MAG TPA: Hsp20/alpha crystallin family protein [Opitutaceae bacterium]|nr:Hsp20/alpha crystallin family protein [Opitutaceae bacterium]
MNTITTAPRPVTRSRAAEVTSPDLFRKPNYECQDHADAMKLVVFVPGVGANGVDIEARGADLSVTARKTQFVRVNWQALHLEGAQRDYRLRLRLGAGFDYAAMQAEIADGVLTVTLPKRAAYEARGAAPLRRVA